MVSTYFFNSSMSRWSKPGSGRTPYLWLDRAKTCVWPSLYGKKGAGRGERGREEVYMFFQEGESRPFDSTVPPQLGK